jgi:CRP-like cAMP-binding protein
LIEGEAGDAAYLIQSGRVDVMAGGLDDRVRVVTLGPGEVLCERSLLKGRPSSAAVVGQTGVKLRRMDHADFLAAVAAVLMNMVRPFPRHP